MNYLGYTQEFWDRLNDLRMNGAEFDERFAEVLEESYDLPTVQERMQALEALLNRAGGYKAYVIRELLEYRSLTTRRRAELTIELAEVLSWSMSTGLYWAEVAAVAQDAHALARQLRDRQMTRKARKLLKSACRRYSPKRHDKTLRR